jgi:hypothetical protein
MTAMLIDRPDHVLADIPMSPAASDAVTGDNAADIVAAYFTPQVTSPQRGTDGQWRFHNDLALVVNPNGVVAWIGPREYPDDDDGVDSVSGRRIRRAMASAGNRPGAVPIRNKGDGGKRGHKGGHSHPTRVENLLERCEAAGLIVEQLARRGKHWKISRPERRPDGRPWPVPPRATSGCVFVSSTTEFRAIAKNTAKILRETGVDVRTIDPAELRRQARRSNGDTTMTAALADPPTVEDSVLTAEPTDAVSTPEPTPEPDPEPVEAAPTETAESTESTEMVAAVEPDAAQVTADRLAFVADMRREGHTDAEIADAMHMSRAYLSAFLSTQRQRNHPLAVPPRKTFTDPRTGSVTTAGVIERTAPPSSAVTVTSRPTRPTLVRLDLVSEDDRAKVLAALAAELWLPRRTITRVLGRRGNTDRTLAVMAALTNSGDARQQIVPRLNGRPGRPSTYLVHPSVPAEQTRPPGQTAEPTADTDPVEAARVAAAQAGEEFLARVAADRAAATQTAIIEAMATVERTRDEVIAEGARVITELVGLAAAPAPEPEPEPVEAETVEAEPVSEAAELTVEVAPVAAEPVEPELPDPARVVEPTPQITEPTPETAEPQPDPAPVTEPAPADPAAEPGAQVPDEQPEFPDDPPRMAGLPVHADHALPFTAVVALSRAAAAPSRPVTAAAPAAVEVTAAEAPAPAPMPTAVTVLEAALRRIGVAAPELVARNLRFELADTGWRLRLEAAL